jgi:hypothetical protein
MKLTSGWARRAAAACALMLLASTPASAQIPGLGVKGGVNFATQHNAGDDDSGPGLKSLAGIVAGVFATLPVASWLEVQPEALYSRKGARAELEGISSDLQIDYLEVPVLARFSRRGSGRGYYVAGGPSFAFQLRARTRTDFGTATEEIDIGEEVERFDLGLSIGGGIEVRSLVIDGRYTHGFKDIDKDTSDDVQVTNRAVSITVGFRF